MGTGVYQYSCKYLSEYTVYHLGKASFLQYYQLIRLARQRHTIMMVLEIDVCIAQRTAVVWITTNTNRKDLFLVILHVI